MKLARHMPNVVTITRPDVIALIEKAADVLTVHGRLAMGRQPYIRIVILPF
jgi:hypothetical protein